MTASVPRTRWKGWTIVNAKGNLALDGTFREPFIWRLRSDAEEVKEERDKVVRCEVRVIIK
jgi:hypothetical protein